MGASKYNETVIKLNGKTLQVPREFFDVAIKASFDQNPQANLTTDSFTFILDAAKEIQSHIDAGLKSGVGIFEGMPLQISATGNNNSISVFNGILDLQDSTIINNELGQIEAKIKQDNGLNNLEDQITLLEGSFFETELGTGYDVCLISGVVLINPEEDCRRLFKLAYDILEPGGLAVIQDYMRLEDNPQRKRLDTMEDLYVLVAFDPGAGDRDGAEVASWLEDAGFQNTKAIPLPTQLGVVTAEKPLTT